MPRIRATARKQVGGEPGLARLGGEVLQEQVDLAIESRRREGGEEVGRSEIAVVLRDLVLQDEVVAPGVPGQLGDEPVILVPILPVVGEDEVRGELAASAPRTRLSPRRRSREGSRPGSPGRSTFAVVTPSRNAAADARASAARSGVAQKTTHSTSRLAVLGDEAQDRPAAADLDVVGVGAERQDPLRSPALLEDRDPVLTSCPSVDPARHRRRCAFQTSHGTWPRV